MRSVKLLTEIPATSESKSNGSPTRGKQKSFLVKAQAGDFLTFQDGVQDPLFNLGFVSHIGSHLGEDELPRSRFKAIPVVFDNWHAVLERQMTSVGLCCV